MIIITSETVVADDTNYYMSNDGNDTNSGTSPDQAWRTISKLNSALQSGPIVDGDDIYFNRGDTFDCTSPSLYIRNRDGTASDPMIFGAYGTGADPILQDTASNGAVLNFLNDGISYITFENLHFRITGDGGASEGIAADAGDSYHITIHDCIFENTAGGYIRTIFKNSHDLTFENCSWISGSLQLYGDGAGQEATSNTIVKNCDIDGGGSGGPDCFVIHDNDNLDTAGNGPNYYISNVTCHNTGSNAFDIVGARSNSTGERCEWVYLKNCKGYDTGGSPPLIVGHKSCNVTIDTCYFYSSYATPLYLTDNRNLIVRNSVLSGPTDIIAAPTRPQYYWGWVIVSNTFYHNTFITGTNGGAGGEFITLGDGVAAPDGAVDGIRFKNNIFYSIQNSAPARFIYYASGPGTWGLTETESNYSYNIWWRGDGSFTNRFVFEDGSYNINTLNALNEAYNNLGQNPNLSNPTGTNFPSDFELNSGSPAVDAGDWLSKTVGGGTGTTITLDDSNYFFPGISDLNVDGDNIFIGDDTDLEVIAIDYVANTITVDRSITWSDGEIVSLSSYHGSAPDIGAVESLFSGPDESFPEISNVLRIESDPLDTDPIYGWVNITSEVIAESGLSDVRLVVTYPDSSTDNISMIHGESDSYYYNTNTIFSDYGAYNYYIWAVDLNGNQSISNDYIFSMPPNWDVNKDGICNVNDLTLVSNQYTLNGANGWIREDIDNNGIIQVLDLVELSSHFDETW
jgi:hypothetical protein